MTAPHDDKHARDERKEGDERKLELHIETLADLDPKQQGERVRGDDHPSFAPGGGNCMA